MKKMMKINEDFWDNNDVEQSEEREIVQKESNPEFRFLWSMNISGERLGNKWDMSPEIVTSYLKSLVHFIKGTTVFNDLDIDRITIGVRCKNHNEKYFNGMNVNEFLNGLPKEIFGVRTEILTKVDLYQSSTVILNVDFIASLDFRSSRDIYSLIKMMFPKQETMRTVINVYPLNDIDPERVKHITFAGIENSFNKTHDKFFVPGDYVMFYLDKEEIDQQSFSDFYWLFMDYDTLVSFKKYIESRYKINGLPYTYIKKIIEDHDENK